MNQREVVRRLHAFRAGKPLPCGETKHVFIAADLDILVVTFVRMGGESRPWGIAWGKPGASPKVLTVPDGRNRDLVAAMSAEFAPALLKHLRTPGFVGRPPTAVDDLAPLRQVWVPNPTHLDMLHNLAFAYTFTKWGAGPLGRLNAFGRACAWLHREAQRPGGQILMTATEALRSAYTFPAEDTRQGHLGYLMAWLEARGGREKRLAAAGIAEQTSISTSLDPDLERKELSPLVERWGEARRASDEGKKKARGREIERILEAELCRRWELTERSIQVLRRDRRRTNAGIPVLVKESLAEQFFQHTRLELKQASEIDGPAFTPSVETDRHPAAAASRFQVHNASADLVEGLLVHDDAELLAEAIASGDALRGEIVSVADESPGRATIPVWVVRDTADRQLRLRTGSRVATVGFSKRQGTIRSLSDDDLGGVLIEIEITANKTRSKDGVGIHALAPIDPDLIGRQIGLVKAPTDGISRRKAQKTWNTDGPGCWLTHARPGGEAAIVQEEDADDVAAVESAEAAS